MEDNNKKGSNVVIEVKANNTETNTSEEIKAQAEIVDADTLSAEELENLSDNNQPNFEKEEILGEMPLKENPMGLAGEAMSLFGKFKSYIGGENFDKVCADAASRNGVDKAVVKNSFIKNALSTIANALNLTVSITGDIIKGAVSFIDNIISTIVDFGTSTLHKLVKVLTLNCGSLEF